MKAVPSEHRQLYLNAIHAGRAEAERLGYGLMDDRIFSTFFRALYQPLLDLHEREIREQVALDIETEGRAAHRNAGKSHSSREDLAYRTSAHIARGGVCVANPHGIKGT